MAGTHVHGSPHSEGKDSGLEAVIHAAHELLHPMQAPFELLSGWGSSVLSVVCENGRSVWGKLFALDLVWLLSDSESACVVEPAEGNLIFTRGAFLAEGARVLSSGCSIGVNR